MTVRRLITLTGSIVVLTIVAFLAITAYWRGSQPTLRDGSFLVSAVQKYSRDFQIRGQTLPASTTLQDLINGGYLSRDDARVFDGMDVTISLTTDERFPQQTLVEARLPSGDRILVLADGSVQQRRK